MSPRAGEHGERGMSMSVTVVDVLTDEQRLAYAVARLERLANEMDAKLARCEENR